MTGPEATQIIARIGLSQRQFALLVGIHPNTVTNWARGTPPSGPAVALLRLLDHRPEDVNVLQAIAGVEPGQKVRR